MHLVLVGVFLSWIGLEVILRRSRRGTAQTGPPAVPVELAPGEAEELEAVVSRLEVGDAAGALRILEALVQRGTGRMDLVRYYLVLAYAAHDQPDQVRATLAQLSLSVLPAPRRYRLAVMLDQARLYDLALPLLEGLADHASTFNDVGERAERIRQIVRKGGTEAFDRQLIAMLDARYTDACVLASGGMGVVFGARDAELGRQVAIKMLSPFLREDTESRARFMREGLTLQALAHPNLVRTFHVHKALCPHYSMELLSGATLAELIRETGPLPLDQVRHISLQILAGLAFCHEKTVIHRDIKPSNIQLPPTGPLKILDFGLVKLARSTAITAAGTIMGTPPYMPPEQLKGADIDHTADLYSFGVLLYEMATGRLPFSPGDDLMRQIIVGAYAPPSTLRADLPPGFDALIARVIHKSRNKRPQLAAEIALELMDLLPR